MSKVDHLPKTLPSREIPFTYSGVGEVTQLPYKGNFVVKVPTVRNISEMGIEAAKLSGGMSEWLDVNTKIINNAVAFLKTCLVECPKWFEEMDYGLDTDDINVVAGIFTQAEELVEKWKRDLKGQPEDDSGQVQK